MINSMRPNGKRQAVAILRRSTGLQDKSLPEQREFIATWAQQNRYAIAHEYVDDAISGDDSAHRNGFQKLLKDLDAPGRTWDVILAYDRARYTRADLYEAAAYADRILKAGADVIFCAEGKALSTDHEIVWAVETYQKHEVLKQTSRDTLRGLMGLARQGYWCGGPIPYGYDAEIVDKLSGNAVRRIRLVRRMRTSTEGTKEPAVHHILDTTGQFVQEVRSSVENALPLKSEAELTRPVLSDPSRVEAIRFIFTAKAEKRMGYRTIANDLNRRGIPSPGGGPLWRTSAVKAILENPIYRGIFEWNSRTEAKYTSVRNGALVARTRAEKARVIENPERDRIRVEAPHLAIVTPDLWHRAQAARAEHADVECRKRERVHTHSLLGGMIFCGECRGKMYAHWSRTRKRIAGELREFVTHLYVCSTYLGAGKDQCGYNKIPRRELETFVLAKIRELLEPALGSSSVRGKVKDKLQQLFGSPKKTDTATLRRKLKDLEERIAILERLETRERAKVGMEAAYHHAKEEAAKVAKQLESAGPEGHPAIDLEAAVEDVMGCLRNLEDFDKLPATAQKTIFSRFVERIDLEFKRIKKGTRERSVFHRGVLTLAPLPASPFFLRLTGSGGPLCTRKDTFPSRRGSRDPLRPRGARLDSRSQEGALMSSLPYKLI